ncbi:MAG: ribonucleoside triphosphate reductase, partial [Stomatobaculum sp.]|nr:ribonucleoside triphosphate reductase [Stomatobaculum sp.]
INMPRIAYLAKDEKDFYRRLDNLMDIAARSLKTKRTVITKLLEQGLYPYTNRYLGTFANHFSTIGLIGMNEVGLNANWIRADLTDPKAQRFTRDVLNHMRERLSDYQEQYGDLYNLEATPAESTTYRFAKHDKEEFPDIITANMNGTPYYTNSSHLPVGFTEDVFSALDIQDDLQTLYTSGTVFHAFLGEKLPDWKAAAKLVKKIAENYKLPYYTMSPTYSICKDHGYLTGEQYTCPYCNQKTEVYSRITGYYRPVQNWNDGKVQEYKDRRVYNIGHSILTHSGPNPAPVDEKPQMYDASAASGRGIAAALNTIEMESTAKEAAAAGRKAEGMAASGPKTASALLFKTSSCPNCKAAVSMLDKAGIDYTEILAEDAEALVEKYSVRTAPTLILLKDGKNKEDGESFETYRGLSDIRGWLRQSASV